MKKLEETILKLRNTKLGRELEKEILERNTYEEFMEWYDSRREPSFKEIKKKLSFVSRWMDWDKIEKVYNQGIDIFIAKCGEGNFKRSKLYLNSRDIKEEEFDKKLPQLISDVYGSLEAYEDYGVSLGEAADKLQKLIDGTKWGMVESQTIKKRVAYPLIKGCKSESDRILEYCERTKS